MIFNEALYPLFLLIAVVVFHLIPLKWRSWWLFLTGLIFYAYYADIFLILFLLEAIIVFFVMKQFPKDKKSLIAAIILSVLILGYFKYRNMAMFTFFTIGDWFNHQGLPEFERLILPLAISFFTFEFIHYVSDLHQNKIKAHSFKDFMAFIMFFPTMIAGPIKRFQHFVPQIEEARFAWSDIHAGLIRILIGSAKKIIVADSMDLWVQPLVSTDLLTGGGTGELWTALLAYSIKIYLDFSGYSDIAIGSARLFGIHVPENFNFPYLKPNIALFWRNWHISLSSWIVDYIFIPLGGSRTTLVMALRNTLLAMAVSGIWHGADWHFVLWGLYHGSLLCLHRLFKDQSWMKYFPKSLATLLTFILVTIGWGLFIMPVEQFMILLPKLFGLGGSV